MRLYVGNLDYDTTSTQLREAFSAFGEVTSADVVTDRETDRPRGFGFVEMPDGGQAQAAIAGLNGRMLGSRSLTVNEARQRNAGGPRSRDSRW